VKKGEMVATVLQPIVEGTEKAITQLDSVIKTGSTGASDEKQALDCTLINKDNVDKLNNFVLAS
jgi:erythritol transport system substrate-binding protein